MADDELHEMVAVAVCQTVASDPAAFWRALTPEQALALLRVAPKVATPWLRDNSGWIRHGTNAGIVASVTYTENATVRWWTQDDRSAAPSVATDVEARDAADAALRAAGWILVDDAGAGA